jgi:hypothetical protein
MALDLNDKSPNGNNLTNVGAAEVTTGLPFAASTEAVDLEASESDYLQANDSPSLSITGDLTIECWVKFESLPAVGNDMAFVAKWGDAAGERSYLFRISNSSGTYQLQFWTSTDGTNYEGKTKNLSSAPSLGTWYHYAVTFDASTATAEFFVNGSSIGTNTGTHTSIADTSQVLHLGKGSETTWYLDGMLDEVRIWNDIRTSTEISDNYQKELSGAEANLVAYWPFETELGALAPKGFAYIFS